jgi:hypothetical protein
MDAASSGEFYVVQTEATLKFKILIALFVVLFLLSVILVIISVIRIRKQRAAALLASKDPFSSDDKQKNGVPAYTDKPVYSTERAFPAVKN